MQGPVNYTAVLDASVLVPGFLSNFLLWLADADLYRAKWSDDIHAEWIRGRLNRYNIPVDVSQARRQTMDREFPHGLVTDYQSLIDGLTLPDVDDRHVLAAAITCGANAIITTNLKHFPIAVLAPYNIVPVHQDDFVLDQLGLTGYTARLVAIAVVRHKKSLTRSRTNWSQYFEAMGLNGVGLQKTHAELTSQEFWALISSVIRSGDWIPE